MSFWSEIDVVSNTNYPTEKRRGEVRRFSVEIRLMELKTEVKDGETTNTELRKTDRFTSGTLRHRFLSPSDPLTVRPLVTLIPPSQRL